MTEFLKDLLGPSIEEYPWIWFLGVWLLGVVGTLWEYKSHQKVQVAAGWFFLLLCFLVYAVANLDISRTLSWIFAFSVFVTGALSIRYFVKRENKKRERLDEPKKLAQDPRTG